jgi:hypothetical protein
MALKGTLRDFGISEILQLIGQQKKSGTLVVTGPQSVVTVLFDGGQIVDAATKPAVPEYDLGMMMTRAGLIHPAQLEMAQAQSKESLQPLELVLLKTKAAAEEDLREMKRLRHLEILYDLFLWKDGEYEFEAGPVNYLTKLVIPASSEQVLMDGYRVKDEWPELAQKIPDLNLRFRRAPGDFSSIDRLDPEDDRIYRLLDGQRTVQDIIFLGRRGKFETLKALARLLERGRIEAVESTKAGLRRSAPAASRMRALAFFGAFFVLALLMLNGVRLNVQRSGWLAGPRVEADSRLGLLARYQTERLRNGLAVYRLCYGQQPAQLQDLVRAGLCRASDLRFPAGKAYSYQRTADGFRLESPILSAGEAK